MNKVVFINEIYTAKLTIVQGRNFVVQNSCLLQKFLITYRKLETKLQSTNGCSLARQKSRILCFATKHDQIINTCISMVTWVPKINPLVVLLGCKKRISSWKQYISIYMRGAPEIIWGWNRCNQIMTQTLQNLFIKN